MPARAQAFAGSLQAIGMVSDFYAGLLVGWQLEGIKFAFLSAYLALRLAVTWIIGIRGLKQPGL